MARVFSVLVMLMVLALTGCSSHMPKMEMGQSARAAGLENSFDVAVLVAGSVATVAGTDNFGATHYVVTKGVGRIVEDFADYQFSQPEQEWMADGVAILGTGLAAAYWYEREGDLSGASTDKKMDAYLPLVPLGQMVWKRLRYVQ